MGNPTNWYFDGELYDHNKNQATVMGIVLRDTDLGNSINIDDRITVQFKVFDFFDIEDMSITQKDRFSILDKLFDVDDQFKYIKYDKYEIVSSEEEMLKKAEEYTAQGYEGVVLRAIDAKYVLGKSKTGGRTNFVQKYKLFDEDSAKIISLEEKPNVEGFGFVFNVKTDICPDIFSINASGTVEYRKAVFGNQEQWIGKYIRFRYTGKTKNKKPKFPKLILDDTGSYKIEAKENMSFDEIAEIKIKSKN